MNFFWVYDISNFYLFLIVTGVFLLIGVGGLLVVGPFVKKWLGPAPASNDVVGNFTALIGTFYGITLGLIAVATWQHYSEADSMSSKEASLLSVMYRNAHGFPDPVKSEIKKELKEITRYIIEEAWPIQKHGVIPRGGTTTRLENILYDFNPKTENDSVILQKQLDLLNSVIESSRGRKENITCGLPAMLYIILFIGAFINISITWFHVAVRKGMHVIITAMSCILIGSLMFLIIAMDYPYYGEFSVDPYAYQLVYDDVMKE